MDVRLPDGTVIRNVPEGTTRSELMRRLQKVQQNTGSAGGEASPSPSLAVDRPPAEPAPIPEPVIPTDLTLGRPSMGESLGQGALTQFVGNILGLPDLAVTTAANAAAALLPRAEKPIPGPSEVLAHAINFASGGRLDPMAAAAELRAKTPDIGDRVIPGMPTGEEAVVGGLALADAGRAVAAGDDPAINRRFEMAQERTTQAREENPGSFFAGEIGGDVATLMLGRPARTRLRALEGRRATLPSSTLPPGVKRQIDDLIRSKFGRVIERTGLRAGEAGLEAATLAVLDEGDPVQTAALAAGGQVFGSAAIGLNKLLVGKGLKDFFARTGGTVFALGGLLQVLQEKIPGGQDRILESIETSAATVAATMALGGMASIAGLDRAGGRFSENLPRIADAMTSIPRGALISAVKDLAKVTEDGDRTAEQMIREMVKDPEAFGKDTLRRVDRAFRNGNLASELERLKKDPKVKKKMDEIEP